MIEFNVHDFKIPIEFAKIVLFIHNNVFQDENQSS
jgi:hypothetical protein